MPFRIRASKFRHVYGNPLRKEDCFENIKITRSTHDSNFCAVNPKYLSVVTETGGGGSFLCIPIKQTGRVEFSAPRIYGHSNSVLDIKWSPFDDSIIASCSEDCTVKVWQIPENLNKNLSEWQVDLHGHQRRVGYIEWHPTAENILLSAGFDHKCIIWNVEQAEPVNIIPGHTDNIFSLSWNEDGSAFCTTCKDKKIRVIDPRMAVVAMEGDGHEGSRSSKSVFIDTGRIFTCGMNRMSNRQLAVWDIKNLSKPLFLDQIDNSNGVLLPYYDRDNKVMYLAGKGDSNIRYYEIDDQSHVHFLSAFMSAFPQRGLGMMPKRGCDTSRCEVMRFYKMHSGKNVIEPISMIVPRKVSQFHNDIFPPTASLLPSLTADEWISGQNREPVLVSMLDGHVTNCPKMTASEAVQNQTNDLVNQAPTITTYKTVNKSGMPPRANTIETTAPRRNDPQKRPASLQNIKRLSTNEDYFSINSIKENNSNRNGISNGTQEEKKVTKKAWSPASPTKDAITNGISGSENEVSCDHSYKFHVKKVWSTPPPSSIPCQSSSHSDVELQKAYFQQSEEIKSLKEQIKLKDKRIRQLEDELSILRTPSDCGPGQSDC